MRHADPKCSLLETFKRTSRLLPTAFSKMTASIEMHEILKLLLLSVVLGLWLYWLWTRRNLYRFSLHYPGFMGPPIIGALGRIKHINSLHQMFEDCKRYSICIWLGIHPVLVTAEPEFIQQVLSSSELLNKAETLYHPIYELFEGGIIASPAVEWSHHRKMINPAFSRKVIVNFIPIFNKAKNLAINKLKPLVDGKEHALANMLQRISLGVTVETTMGKFMKETDEVDADLADKFSFMMEKVAKQCLLSYMHLDSLYNLSFEFKKTRSHLWNFVAELLKHKINKQCDGNCQTNGNTNAVPKIDTAPNTTKDPFASMKKPPSIFIDHALKLYEDHQFSEHDLLCESVTLVSASFETTANTIFSALVMLAMHPEVQERLYEEILNIFPEKNFEMQYEDMQQLPYLARVINETLRVAPSVPLIGRHVVKDTLLSKDLWLPQNMQILISIFHLHRRKDIWGANADNFDPDNFLPENMAEKHPYAFIPFAKGIRNCIGWRYALFLLTVTLAGLIRNYKFTTRTKKEDLKFVDNIALKFLNEPLLKIEHR